MKNFLKWTFGIIFALAGIFSITENPLMALPILLLGLFLIPPVLNWFQKKIKYTFSRPLKWVIAIGLFMSVGFLQMAADTVHDSGIDTIVEQASEEVDKGNMEEAYRLIYQAKREYSDQSSNPAVNLENEIKASQSERNAKEALARMSSEEFELFQKGELNKNYLDQETLNKNFYSLIENFVDERPQLVLEHKKAEVSRLRSDAVSKQFYADGSHPTLTNFVERNLKNPDSFEHVKTTHYDEGDLIFVTMTYRGTNSFNAIITNSITARVDLYGKVVEIVE